MTFVKADKGTTNNKNDKIMTPDKIAKELIALLPIDFADTVLDPFKGEGAFFNNIYSKNKYWAEIDQGKDFFHIKESHYKWIISNPPYSIFDSVLEHSFEIAENVCYLVPLSKIFSSMGRIKHWKRFGNIRLIYIMPAGQCGFPFGFPAAFVWWEKGYTGNTEFIIKNNN